jgi:hypothetical protein
MLAFISSFAPQVHIIQSAIHRKQLPRLLQLPLGQSRQQFHASAYPSKRKFEVPRLTLLRAEDKVNKKATKASLYLDDVRKLKPFAENIITRRDLMETHRVVDNLRDLRGRSNDDLDETMRRKIVSGEVELSFRETQKLCSANKLGAKGSKVVLAKRLLTFFERVAPESLASMDSYEILNYRCNLDGDKTEEYKIHMRETHDECLRRHEAEDEANGWPSWAQRQLKYSLSTVSFIADLSLRDKRAKQASEQRAAEKLRNLVSGKFYASPSPTGRATCRSCGEKIAQKTVRVTEHDLERFYNRSGGWTPRQSERQHHAICFLVDSSEDLDDAKPVIFGKDAEVTDMDDSSLSMLRDAIMEANGRWAKDKDWNQMLRGAVSLRYRADAIMFGHDDPDNIRTTVTHNAGSMMVTSEEVDKSERPPVAGKKV